MNSSIDPLLFEHLQRIAEGIVAVVGPHCEVVIHSFEDPEHSAIYIAGNLTGRKPGAPVPDLSFISGDLTHDAADQLNYTATIGKKSLQSTTNWIRDSQGEIVGALCINIDYSQLVQARYIIDTLILPRGHPSGLVVEETFARNVDELIETSVQKFLKDENLPSIEKIDLDDKIRIVKYLDQKRLFQIRGAINKLANLFNVSRATIYNYRSEKADEVTFP
jgi:predicted transcriptional regulator YheO